MKDKARIELLDEVRSLRQRQDELHHVYREAPVGLCYLDRDLRYVQINDWLAAINRLSAEEHIGRSIRDVLPEIAAAGAEAQLRSVLETGEPVLNGTVYAETAAHPGSKRLYQHSYYANRSADGTIVGVSCILEDTTEYNRVEEALRASEERFRTLFSNAGDAILIVDTEGRIVDANRRPCSSLGYSLHELQGLTIPDIDVDWSPNAIRSGPDGWACHGRPSTPESILDVQGCKRFVDMG